MAACILIRRELVKKGFEADLAYDLIIYGAIGGILGGRILYIITHPGYYLAYPLRLFSIQDGLIFYGGLLGGFLFVAALLKRRHLSVLVISDAASPALAFGAAIGRIGCFFAGCCYGELLGPRASGIFGAIFNSRHPTQIYDFLYNLAIFFYLHFFFSSGKKDGDRFFLFLLLYALGRFTVEFFRVSKPVFLTLTGAQIISLGLFLFSLYRLKYAALNEEGKSE